MEELVKGDIVVLPFPFSDLSSAKRRPALVLGIFEQDALMCMITSVLKEDGCSVPLSTSDFAEGGLPAKSWIRVHRLFTAERSIILYKAGALKEKKLKEAIETLIALIRR